MTKVESVTKEELNYLSVQFFVRPFLREKHQATN